jgi:hypothetical protein
MACTGAENQHDSKPSRSLSHGSVTTDKGEVGGSSPPRPTIQITNKYAAILTFPFQGTCHQKTVLPKICQKSSRP